VHWVGHTNSFVYVTVGQLVRGGTLLYRLCIMLGEIYMPNADGLVPSVTMPKLLGHHLISMIYYYSIQ